jgi:hypothetical protein
VLGSGFHHALTELRVAKKISYAKILIEILSQMDKAELKYFHEV